MVQQRGRLSQYFGAAIAKRLINNRIFFFSQLWRLERLLSGHQYGLLCWEPSLWLMASPFYLCLYLVHGARDLCWVSFYNTSAIQQGGLLGPNSSQKTYFLIPSHWALEFQPTHSEFWRGGSVMQTFRPQYRPPLKKM